MAKYIDADKMREEWLENGENEYVYDTNSVLDSIDAQPTADVVEVKRGEWKRKGQDIYCSVCGNESAYNPFGASKFSDYCPNCGADMRSE